MLSVFPRFSIEGFLPSGGGLEERRGGGGGGGGGGEGSGLR